MSSRPFLTDCGCDCAVNTQEPTAANGWKGELLISDPYNGADVFGEFRDLPKVSEISVIQRPFSDRLLVIADFTITLTCIGTAPVVPVRLSCVHNAGGGGTSPCKTVSSHAICRCASDSLALS